MPIWATKTSFAAKAPTIAVTIFQSKPRGLKTGSSTLPILPA